MVFVVGGGGLLAVVGAFGPWATAGLFSKSGMDGDGVITLVVAAVLLLVTLANARTPRRGVAIGAIVSGVIIAGVGAVDIADINNKVSDNAFTDAIVDIGWGLYLTVAAGIIAVVGGVGLIRERR